MLILRIKYLQEKFFNDYLLLQNEKVKFFKQHTLWKYRKSLIKLFEFPESIINWNSFEFELYALKNLINKYGYDVWKGVISNGFRKFYINLWER